MTACQDRYVSLSSDQLPLCHGRGPDFESRRPRHSFGGVPDVTPATSTSHHFSIEQKSRQQRRAARQLRPPIRRNPPLAVIFDSTRRGVQNTQFPVGRAVRLFKQPTGLENSQAGRKRRQRLGERKGELARVK